MKHIFAIVLALCACASNAQTLVAPVYRSIESLPLPSDAGAEDELAVAIKLCKAENENIFSRGPGSAPAIAFSGESASLSPLAAPDIDVSLTLHWLDSSGVSASQASASCRVSRAGNRMRLVGMTRGAVNPAAAPRAP